MIVIIPIYENEIFLRNGPKINDKKKYLFKCFDLNFEVSMFVSETIKKIICFF